MTLRSKGKVNSSASLRNDDLKRTETKTKDRNKNKDKDKSKGKGKMRGFFAPLRMTGKGKAKWCWYLDKRDGLRFGGWRRSP
jgi:hypothetical protein